MQPKKEPKELIGGILDIIGFEEDKEEFTENFLSLCLRQALFDLIDLLPKEKQQDFLDTVSSSQDLETDLKKYFNDEQIRVAVKSASEKAMKNYLETIAPTLSDIQAKNLDNYLQQQSPSQTLVN